MRLMSPCKTCERKGCGSYHDECELYKKWREAYEKLRKPQEQHRTYIKQTTFKSRTSGQFRSHKK